MGAELGLALAASLGFGVGLTFGIDLAGFDLTGLCFSCGFAVLACALLATRALLLFPSVGAFLFFGVAVAILAFAISKKVLGFAGRVLCFSAISKKVLGFAGRVLCFSEEDSEGLEEVPEEEPGKTGDLVWLEELAKLG